MKTTNEPKRRGRPSKYSDELLQKAQHYEENWEALGDTVPQLAGLCVHCKISKDSMYTYERDHEEFSAVCARVRVMQETELINRGLSRQTDASLSKLLLMKHGYSDRQEVDHTTNGESINGTATPEQLAAAKREILNSLNSDD